MRVVPSHADREVQGQWHAYSHAPPGLGGSHGGSDYQRGAGCAGEATNASRTPTFWASRQAHQWLLAAAHHLM
jgi:hypothetical protein